MYPKFVPSPLILRSLALTALGLSCLSCAHAEVEGLDDPPTDAELGGKSGSGGSSGHAGVSYGGYTAAGSGGTVGAAGNAGAGASSGGATNGGTSGSGGSATGGGGSSSGGSGGAPVVSADGFSVQYKVEQTTGTIGCQLTLKNSGSLTVPLSEFKLRYYFTNEVSVSTVTDINWAGVNPGAKDFKGQVTTEVVDLTSPTSTADSYLEFSFTGSALSVAPNDTADLSWQFHAGDWSQQYTQTGDYSFDAAKTALTAWDHVVLLRNGGIVWGAEP